MTEPTFHWTEVSGEVSSKEALENHPNYGEENLPNNFEENLQNNLDENLLNNSDEFRPSNINENTLNSITENLVNNIEDSASEKKVVRFKSSVLKYNDDPEHEHLIGAGDTVKQKGNFNDYRNIRILSNKNNYRKSKFISESL